MCALASCCVGAAAQLRTHLHRMATPRRRPRLLLRPRATARSAPHATKSQPPLPPYLLGPSPALAKDRGFSWGFGRFQVLICYTRPAFLGRAAGLVHCQGTSACSQRVRGPRPLDMAKGIFGYGASWTFLSFLWGSATAWPPFGSVPAPVLFSSF